MASYQLFDPNETIDFSVDWTNELDDGSPSDTIDSSTWEIDPQEGSPQSPDLSGPVTDGTGKITSVKVTNGTRGEIYRLTNRIVTGQGRTLDRSWVLRCRDR